MGLLWDYFFVMCMMGAWKWTFFGLEVIVVFMEKQLLETET